MKVSLHCFSVFIPCKLCNIQNLFCQFVVTNFSKKNCLVEEKSEKAMAPHSGTLAWKIPWTEEPWWAAVPGVARSQTRLSDFTFTFRFHALEKEMAIYFNNKLETPVHFSRLSNSVNCHLPCFVSPFIILLNNLGGL